jgi:type II secretory pathway component GspD/PulD (secretin)
VKKKIIISILIISLFLLSANVMAFDMEKDISFNLRKGSKLKEAFDSLENISNGEISFYYDSGVNLNKRFKMTIQNKSFQSVMNLILQLNLLKANKVTDQMYFIYPAAKEADVKKSNLQVYQQVPVTIKEVQASLRKIYRDDVELETNKKGDILFVKTDKEFVAGIDKVVNNIVENNTRIRVMEKEYQLTYISPKIGIEKIEKFFNNTNKKLEDESKDKSNNNSNNDSILLNSVVNESKNSIIIQYDKKYQKTMEALIKKIDTRAAQVEVKVSILEISRDKLKSVGIDYDLSRVISDLVQYDTIYPKKLPGTSYASIVESYSNVLSSPKIRIIDREEGNIKIGKDIPIVTVEKEDEDAEVVPSVEYRHVGIDLKIKPKVHLRSGEISLNLDLSVDSLGEKEATPYGEYYKINIKNINSKIRLKNEKTVAIGGLITEKERKKNTRIPILSKLPIIGKIFQKTEKSPEKSEIIMLITPRLVNSAAEETKDLADIRKRVGAEFNYDQRLKNAHKTITRLLRERKNTKENPDETAAN